MKKEVFLKNAAVLTASSLILRLLSLLLRGWLSYQIGVGGIGEYQLILSVFLPAVSLATGGISLTVTRLTSLALGEQRETRIRSGVHRCMAFSLCFSLGACVLLDFLALPLSRTFLSGVASAHCLWILSAGLPFMSVSSCIRGYFLAMHCTIRPALCEGFEQISGIVLILLAFSLGKPATLESACLFMMAASTLSEILSCLFSILLYRGHALRFLPAHQEPYPQVGRSIRHITLPGTLSYAARNCLNMAVNLLIPMGLMQYGAGKDAALAQYGMLEGMVIPLLTFPSVFLTSVSSLLIPEVAQSMAAQNRPGTRAVASRALQAALLFSIPVTCFFFLFGSPIGTLFYGRSEAGEYLRMLAPLTPLWYLDTIVDSLLKGLDQQTPSFLYNTLDAAVRTALIWLLLPKFGLQGYIAILFLCSIGNAFLSLHRLLKVTGAPIRWRRWVLIPAGCCLLCGEGMIRLLGAAPPETGLFLGLPAAGLLSLLLMKHFHCFARVKPG